jgi:hypothetical protein
LTVRANLVNFDSHQILGISDAENAVKSALGFFVPLMGSEKKIFGALIRPLLIEN